MKRNEYSILNKNQCKEFNKLQQNLYQDISKSLTGGNGKTIIDIKIVDLELIAVMTNIMIVTRMELAMEGGKPEAEMNMTVESRLLPSIVKGISRVVGIKRITAMEKDTDKVMKMMLETSIE